MQTFIAWTKLKEESVSEKWKMKKSITHHDECLSDGIVWNMMAV